ncbi:MULTISPECIES: hypothetical protein [Shouchella]|uniref:Uncharacterized protein n=2 Tax=Shouchella TaxID=2893057 RepID=A0ABY7W2G3_9BACI|nr:MULTISPECIES: hypothetical protein [Shouchella]MED4127992.1 hypothetical protein [Shouchella miscanthi]WDF03137.1 hypothetical protein PQ477_16810 [Shouchella hunanensis]GAF21393.1 hypothetical protein JCM19047_1071 [Bacillus sp. JCM 19047]
MKKHIRPNQVYLAGSKTDVLLELKKAALHYTFVQEWIQLEHGYGHTRKVIKRIK